MSRLPISAVMSAMAAAAEAMKEHDEALDQYTDHSWDYHGASYITAVSNATAAAEMTLETYIQQCVQDALANLADSNS